MAKVTIIVEGIAVIYHKKDRVWRYLFPFDQCHAVKFKLPNEPKGGGLSLAGAGRQIRISAEQPTSKFNIGGGYDKFVDLTADYAHENGVKAKKDWSDKAVLMTIENAEVSMHEPTKSEYQVTENGVVRRPPAIIGYSSKIEISGEKVVLAVSGAAESFSLIFEDDATLFFDNDCLLAGGGKESSDMDMLYAFMEDKKDRSRRISVERPPAAAAEPEKTVVGTRSTNPPPGEEGLPCHQGTIGDPNDMP